MLRLVAVQVAAGATPPLVELSRTLQATTLQMARMRLLRRQPFYRHYGRCTALDTPGCTMAERRRH